MKKVLFGPFDAKKWCIIGFTAWLAELAARGGSSGGNASVGDAGDAESVDGAWQALLENGPLLALGAVGCVFLIAVAFIVMWISARGKFMFLDNVVFDRALVVDPWKRYRRQGNSLFLFQILFYLACALLVGGVALLIASTVGLGAWAGREAGVSVAAMAVIGGGSLALLILTVAYAVFFLDAFVVPLMHRYGLGVVDGWRRFFGLFAQRPWPFLLCGLLAVALGACVMVLVVGFGLLTCCVGFLLLVIPYVSSVILLPITVFYRGFTIEFLGQFDSDLLPGDPDGGSRSGNPPVPPVAEATA